MLNKLLRLTETYFSVKMKSDSVICTIYKDEDTIYEVSVTNDLSENNLEKLIKKCEIYLLTYLLTDMFPIGNTTDNYIKLIEIISNTYESSGL